ncbi:hypothetical protein M0R89_03205 [Halorussus limi]|uniref:Uncharacterized protein n=1 Tax=Halorussus limi TaxID=2938695 RepID=A0A8U0HWW5_9EURY|nr:hypothetical protein [Halorussus limi]UPV75084.1 hypothetical protein M0R89_03205 [Halorussus limi]
MPQPTRFAVALAVVLVLAGAAPAAGDRTPRASEVREPDEVAGLDGVPETHGVAGTSDAPGANRTATDETVEIETEGFDPDYDPSTVLSRVEELRDLSATQGITLHEYDADEGPPYDVRDTFGAIRPVGAQALQLYSNASTEHRQPLGYTVERQAAVHIYLLNESDLAEHGVSQEAVLAHEFVHALQFQHDLLTPSRREFRSEFDRWTTDSRLVTTAIVEGDAMWVTEQYFEKYDDSDYSVSEYNRTLARAAWPHSVAGTPYYYGYEYYESAGSSPADRSAAIERPPNSTAELLHPGETVERVPLPPDPEIPDDRNLTRYHADRVGELVVRHALRMNGLSFARAADVADGWANDRMYYYAAAGATGPATHWVTTWESEREAREFAAAWREMLDANGARASSETDNSDTLFVPASDHAPGVHYVVERDGATVRITAAEVADTAESLADAAGESADDPANSSETESNETDG